MDEIMNWININKEKNEWVNLFTSKLIKHISSLEESIEKFKDPGNT